MGISSGKIGAALRALGMVALLGVGGGVSSALAQEPGFGFGDGFDDNNGGFFDHDFAPERIICLSDNQIRQTIADRGYTHISLNVPDDKRIQVRATKDGTVYLLKFNYCSGRIEDRTALRAAQ